MSEKAQAALIDAPSSAVGVQLNVQDKEIDIELYHASLIGPGGGLTRKGSIERDRLITARMDDLF